MIKRSTSVAAILSAAPNVNTWYKRLPAKQKRPFIDTLVVFTLPLASKSRQGTFPHEDSFSEVISPLRLAIEPLTESASPF